MTLQEILRLKGTNVLTIHPDATLDEVVQKLVKHNCGSLVVCLDEGASGLIGIITERHYGQDCYSSLGPTLHQP